MAVPFRQSAAGQKHVFNNALVEALLRFRCHVAALGSAQHFQYGPQHDQRALGARRADATVGLDVVLRPWMPIGGLASAEILEDTEEGTQVWTSNAVVGGVGNVRGECIGFIHGDGFGGNAGQRHRAARGGGRCGFQTGMKQRRWPAGPKAPRIARHIGRRITRRYRTKAMQVGKRKQLAQASSRV